MYKTAASVRSTVKTLFDIHAIKICRIILLFNYLTRGALKSLRQGSTSLQLQLHLNDDLIGHCLDFDHQCLCGGV